jgi:hypothetical protein
MHAWPINQLSSGGLEVEECAQQWTVVSNGNCLNWSNQENQSFLAMPSTASRLCR